jgi:hypothetical protein
VVSVTNPCGRNLGFLDRKNYYIGILKQKKTKLRGLSPRANFTDRAAASCRPSWCQLFVDKGCHVVSVTDPYGRILGFLDRTPAFCNQKYTKFTVRLLQILSLFGRYKFEPKTSRISVSWSTVIKKRIRLL